jgi:hypothetical protein
MISKHQEEVFDSETQMDTRNLRSRDSKKIKHKEEKRVSFIKQKKEIQKEEQAAQPIPEEIKVNIH